NTGFDKPVDSFYFIDIHTRSSIKLDDGTFLTERTVVGELLYQFKYCFDQAVKEELSQIIYSYIDTNQLEFDVLIPIPPSNLDRPFQPVMELAISLSLFGVTVDLDYLVKT